jgi:hypothetical protein
MNAINAQIAQIAQIAVCDCCSYPVEMVVDGVTYPAACLCDRDAAEAGEHGVVLAPFFSPAVCGAEDLPF